MPAMPEPRLVMVKPPRSRSAERRLVVEVLPARESSRLGLEERRGMSHDWLAVRTMGGLILKKPLVWAGRATALDMSMPPEPMKSVPV